MLRSLPAEAMEQIRERARADAARYVTGDGSLEIPGVTLLASGRASSP